MEELEQMRPHNAERANVECHKTTQISKDEGRGSCKGNQKKDKKLGVRNSVHSIVIILILCFLTRPSFRPHPDIFQELYLLFSFGRYF